MIPLTELRKSLVGTQGSNRRSKIEEFARTLDQGEREIYLEFLEKANRALKFKGTVTRAYSFLVNNGNFFYEPSDFGIHYQIACAIAERPIVTPAEALRELKRPKRNLGRNRIIPILERYKDRSSESSILELGED
jgi:hypothetical protein